MKVRELINHLEDIIKDSGEDTLVAIDIKINGYQNTRSEISNIKLYGKNGDTGNSLITLESDVNLLGSVDTSILVNKRINELIDAANGGEE